MPVSGCLTDPDFARVDDLLAAGDRRRQPGPLAADPGEVGGELVELRLVPRFEGVVVALGTFEPDAQEELADHRRDLFGLATVAEDRRRPLLEGAPARRDDRVHELVVRHVAAERVADPAVEVQDGLDPHAVGVRAEQVDPLVGPVVGVFGSIEQAIDQPRPLAGRRVGEELTRTSSGEGRRPITSR